MANSKWEGKASVKINGTAEQVWPFLQDFCNIQKWSPSITTCHKLEGVDGQPGLVRYCGFASPDGDQAAEVKFTHEKLLTIDPIQRSFSYTITDNNVGFKDYVATWKVKEVEEEGGCEIEWGFVADAIEGWKYEDFFGIVEFGLKGMAERINKAFE